MSNQLPALPPPAVPSGTDVRDLRPWFNAVQSCLTSLVHSARAAALQPRQWSPPPHIATQAGVPVGGVIIWFGAAPGGQALTIPGSSATWAVCDGSTVNGWTTPDLRGYFLRGKTVSDDPGTTSDGGSGQPDYGGANTHTHDDHTLSISGHTHSIPSLDVSPDPSGQAFCTGETGSATIWGWSGATDLATGTGTSGSAGGISETLTHSTEDNVPEYAVAVFLMRIA